MKGKILVLCFLAVLLIFEVANSAEVTYFEEDFSSGEIPSDWTIVDGNSDGISWMLFNYNYGCSQMVPPVASADSDYWFVAFNDELWTPILDLSECTGVHVKWTQDFNYLSSGDVASVAYSLNGGTTWTTLYTWTSDNLCAAQDFDLTGIADGVSTFVFKWKYQTTGIWQWWYVIDNVKITGECFGLYVDPKYDSKKGTFGETVTYTLTVINNTNSAASYNVACDSDKWEISCPATTGTIESYGTKDIEISVKIPETAGKYYYYDEATVTISGNSLSATAQLKTYVYEDWQLIGGRPPEPKFWFGSAAKDGKLYVVGGLNDQLAITNKMFSYDTATGEWQELAPMPTGLMLPVCDFIGDLLFCVGGGDANFIGSALVQVYDPATDTWSTDYAPLPNPRQGGVGGTVNGKFYYVSGGPDGYFSNVSTDVYEYDPEADSWTTKASFPYPTGLLIGAGTPCGDKLYVGGDYRGFDQFLVYNPASDSWTALTPIPTEAGKMSPTMVCHKGDVYLWGGDDYGFWWGEIERTTWVYKTEQGYWEELPYLLNFPVLGHSGEVLGFYLYTYGGTQGYGALIPAPFEKLAVAYLYLVVSPDSAEIEVGETVQLTAKLYEFGGEEIEIGEVKWETSDEEIATVDENGLVKGVDIGKATITATYEGFSDTASIRVVAPSADDDTDDDEGEEEEEEVKSIGGCGC